MLEFELKINQTNLQGTYQKLLKNMKKQPSPIKVKDYFTNPLHKIKQPCFVKTGFNQSHLNTFVKAFTNRSNNNYISIPAIKNFIKNFTNNNPKLMQTYEQFFYKNFKIKDDELIDVEHFIEFFLKEQQQKLEYFDQKRLKSLYKELAPLSQEKIVQKCSQLDIAMDKDEASKLIKMLNYDAGIHGEEDLKQQAFLKAIKQK